MKINKNTIEVIAQVLIDSGYISELSSSTKELVMQLIKEAVEKANYGIAYRKRLNEENEENEEDEENEEE